MDSAVVEGENRDEPLPSAPIGAATSPEGGGLGKEGRPPPHSSTARRSQLISGKLYALAKASTFGGGGTAKPCRRGFLPERTLSVSLRSTALPKGEPLAKRESLILIGQLLEESDL